MFYRVFLCCIICFLGPSLIVSAQDDSDQPCFTAHDILFPLDSNDFRKSATLINEMQVNALYYLYQDKFTFWYRFIMKEDAEINYKVVPSNNGDIYQSMVYKYSGTNFCDDLVNEKLSPMATHSGILKTTSGRMLVSNTLSANKGDTLYLSVLSLNNGDCGHKLYIDSFKRSLSLHAIHRPCYNVKVINDFLDVEMEIKNMDNIDLVMEDIFKTTANEDSLLELNPEKKGINEIQPEKIEGKQDLSMLKDISIQNKEADKLSEGDKLFLDRVFFYTNNYAFKSGAKKEMDQIAEFLKQNPEIKVEVQGHTANNSKNITPDPNYKSLGPEWNFKGSSKKLSKLRAKAVEDYLIEQGVSGSQLKSAGYGDELKRFPNPENEEEIEKNMRVEILILSEE